jgi:putative transposase
MTRYVDAHKDQYGVEPICRVLKIAPSTYYAAVNRPPCAREVRDEQLKPEVARVHKENFGVYGVHKVWRQLNREGLGVGRDRVGRLMAKLQLAGIRRGRVKRTTFPGEAGERAQDLVERAFVAVAPNRLWVADLTYVSTWSGFCYVAFVVDVFSRRIVGWRVTASLHAELALDALEMAIWSRRTDDLSSLVHHSDRGIQYLAIRYTERLAEAGAVRSVGSRGDSYDNALAETVNGLYKTELIRRRGRWRSLEQIELATAEWIEWWNHRRLHGATDDLPPAEYEDLYYRQRDTNEVA